MGYYKDIPTEVLEMMWEDKKAYILAGCPDKERELAEAYKIRLELDRRKGNISSLKPVNFEDYTTD